MKNILITICLFGYFFSPGQAVAQSSPMQESDITTAIAKINGPDPIQRVLDTRSALQSPDPLLRSFALEEALRSNDGRVREQALFYLVNIQKQFIVSVDMPTNPSVELNSRTKMDLQSSTPMKVVFSQIDEETLNFSVNVNNYNLSGNISQDGINILIPAQSSLGYISLQENQNSLPCELQFRGFADGFMRGAVNCGPLSFPARTPLP